MTGPGNHEVTCNQLGDDLQNANANRPQVPWIGVTGHRPFYSSVPASPAVTGNCSACGNSIIPLILQYNVDIYIGGHIHGYERLYPIDANGNAVANNYNNTSGSINVTNGAGGATQIQSTIPASAKIVTGYGYSQVNIIHNH